MLLLAFGGLIAGFAALLWSADRFVVSASTCAKLFGISSLVIGVVVVGFGTSAPEMLVSAIAAFDGESGLSIGNALGSNITNIGLIIGLTALFYPLQIKSRIVRREMPLLLLFMAGGLLLMLDGDLNRIDGIVLFSCLVMIMGWTIHEARQHRQDILATEFESEIRVEMSAREAVTMLLLSMLLLLAASRLLVWSAIEIAHAFNVSDLIIGLTVVALGTSLPELAASIAAARKGEHDIAIGNITGSNMFNLLGVMALPGIIAPGSFEPGIIVRDFPLMIALSALLWFFASNFSLRNGGQIKRLEGGVLVAIYLGYIFVLYLQVMASA